MKHFMDEDFLLNNDIARRLYHEHAEQMPIIDYHCHINPAEIAENRCFDTITQAWLGGDHYKWRLMRSNGVPERLITGEASDREKFQAFAETLPKAIGNPMYHWTHLELKRYFACDTPLNGQSAEAIWKQCNAKLQEKALHVRGIIESSRVTHISTTDDPADELNYHRLLRNDASFNVTVTPAWRPDKAMNIEKEDFPAYIERLGLSARVSIASYADVLKALALRLDHFSELGCRASDHGLNACIHAPASAAELEGILARRMDGATLLPEEVDKYKYGVLRFLAGEYAKRGWVMELHYGTLRNTNAALFRSLGPDTGFDCISGEACGNGLARFLDALFVDGCLPKTLIFSLNPADNALINTVAGCFQGSEAAAKIQQGAAWWFNDTRSGMLAQMTSMADLALLGNFVGMLTDSRSFLSYTRHEYFRRILCNLIGTWVDQGEYPADLPSLGQMVEDISYKNAIRYFGF